MTKEQMNAIWRKPGVAQAGHLTLWYAIDHHKRGAPRKPAWDKALLKRAKRMLPNWYAMRNDPYHF